MAIKINPDWLSDDNSDNRGERRRALYLGEKVRCTAINGLEQFSVEIVDISPKGLGFIDSSNKPESPFKINDEIHLVFSQASSPWELKATVSNVTSMSIQKQLHRRVGVRFHLAVADSYSEFSQAIGQGVISCKTYVRPQVSCRDPFFYKETILFQCNGFAANGIDLVCSSRWKSILPGQHLQLKVYIPGEGEFPLLVKNSRNFYQSQWKDRFRIFLEYLDASEDYQHAVCEYLVMMRDEVTPTRLREFGFLFHNFNNACYLEKAIFYLRSYPPQEFLPSFFAQPDQNPPNVKSIKSISRELCCKLGPNRVAYFNLVFFNGLNGTGKTHSLQAFLRDDILFHTHVIMTNLIVSKKVTISDILVPMIQQVIRITAQSKSRFLVLKTDGDLVKIFKKIGFKPLARVPGGDSAVLVSLDITSALANQSSQIESHVWNKVYKDLSLFLGKSPRDADRKSSVLNYQFISSKKVK